MTIREKKYLVDILNSSYPIEAFTKDLNSFEEYKNNFLIKAGVERHLGIIGEEVNKFIKRI